MSLLYIKGFVDHETYETFCNRNNTTPENAVFIFPGNPSHHGPTHNLYSKKSGGGIAAFTGSLGDKGLPVLSLPTTGMGDVSKDLRTAHLANSAVEDLWKAVGAGYQLVLPVRDHKNKQYFKTPLTPQSNKSSPVEPSFWGGIEKKSNKHLAEFYVNHLNRLVAFLAVKDTPEEQSFLTELRESENGNLVEAYQKGQTMAENDPWLNNPKGKKAPVLKNPAPQKRDNETKTPYQLRKQAILALLGSFNERDYAEEGLFRISSSVDIKKETVDALLKGNLAVLDSMTDPHLKTSVLKQLIRDLGEIDKQPLLSNSVRYALLTAQATLDSEKKLKLVKTALNELSHEDKQIFKLVLHICDKVSRQPSSKMSTQSLAIALAPGFINAFEMVDMSALQKINDFNQIFQFIVDNGKEISASLDTIKTEKNPPSASAKSPASKTTKENRSPVTPKTSDSKLSEESLSPALSTPKISENKPKKDTKTKSIDSELFNKLKDEIEHKNWIVGWFGGVTVQISDGTSKVMPHHVAKLYKLSKQSTPATFEQDIKTASHIISDRNMPKDVFDWVKYIVKLVDLFGLISRHKTTENFYLKTQSQLEPYINQEPASTPSDEESSSKVNKP